MFFFSVGQMENLRCQSFCSPNSDLCVRLHLGSKQSAYDPLLPLPLFHRSHQFAFTTLFSLFFLVFHSSLLLSYHYVFLTLSFLSQLFHTAASCLSFAAIFSLCLFSLFFFLIFLPLTFIIDVTSPQQIINSSKFHSLFP